MNVRLIRASEQPVSFWSGGTTTQLYIYPETAVYRRTPFLFRLSSATVEQEESQFTRLDGVERTLMILDGRVVLKSALASRELSGFEQMSFSGGMDVTSSGKCVDFNLMTMSGCRGTVHAVSLEEAQRLEQPAGEDAVSFYLLDGQMDLEISDRKFTLYPKDIIIVFAQEKKARMKIQAQAVAQTRFIRTDLSLRIF